MERTITGLVVRQGSVPEEREIVIGVSGLRTLQGLVNGCFDVARVKDDSVCLIVNEALGGLEISNAFNKNKISKDEYDFGSFVIVGTSHGELCSLSDEQIEKYKTMFS